ncbi:MAG: hypothetical protein FWD06_01575 [Oscillospiraceae bacterium]|nr:hypothetical protein [Oscillospiraceae bacterium]
MKKIARLLAMILALVMLVGCASLLPHTRVIEAPASPTRGETNATGPFAIHAGGGNGFDFSFTLRNDSDEIFFYSDAYRLYVYADTWLLHHEHTGIGAEYYLRPGLARNIFVPWHGRGGGQQIEPGNYRLVFETIEIEFEQLHWSDEAGLTVQWAAQRQDRIDFITSGQPASGAAVSNISAMSTGMEFTLRNDSPTGFFYGYGYDMARYEDGRWVAVPIVGEPVWRSLGFTLQVGETRDYTENWTHLFGELPAGRYMFIREMSLTDESFVETRNDGMEQWSDIHHRYPTQVYLMIEFELE